VLFPNQISRIAFVAPWNFGLDPGRSLLDLGRLQRDLEALLAAKVDVVSARGLRERVRQRVLQDAVLI
jgi:hypothetical protein